MTCMYIPHNMHLFYSIFNLCVSHGLGFTVEPLRAESLPTSQLSFLTSLLPSAYRLHFSDIEVHALSLHPGTFVS